MPTSKKRTSRKSGKGKPRTPKEEAAQRPVDGVLIQYPGEGKVAISPLGGIKATELPTLLRQAAQTVERELGIA